MISALSLEQTILSLCRDAPSFATKKTDEGELWLKLVTNVLSSQVAYELAEVFGKFLHDCKLLLPDWSGACWEEYHHEVSSALKTPREVRQRKCRYRFPNSKSKQIVTTVKRFSENSAHLSEMAYSQKDCKLVRSRLCEHVDGFGPKQASMFLRDIGRGHNLAIIDRHILQYMEYQGLISANDAEGFNSRHYDEIEAEFIRYANFLGVPVGRLDWTVWVVMRTAKRKGMI